MRKLRRWLNTNLIPFSAPTARLDFDFNKKDCRISGSLSVYVQKKFLWIQLYFMNNKSVFLLKYKGDDTEIADSVIESCVIFVQSYGFCNCFFSVGDLDVICAVKARKTELFIGFRFHVGAPFFIDQLVQYAVRGFFGTIAANQTAVENVFSLKGCIVGKIPPNDGAAMLTAEPKLIKPFDKRCLRFFIFACFFSRPGGNGYLGHMNGKPQFAVAFKDIKDPQGVTSAFNLVKHFDTFPMRPKCVKLHTDTFDGGTFSDLFTQCHMVIAAVAAVMITDGFLHAFIPEKAGIRKITLAKVKAPFFMIALVRNLQIAATVACITIFIDRKHFVDYVNVRKFCAVTLRDGAQTRIDFDLDLAVIVGKPAWLEGIVDETMPLHSHFVFFAKFNDGVKRRTTMNERGILFKARFTFLRFKGIPIKGDHGVIKKIFEF